MRKISFLLLILLVCTAIICGCTVPTIPQNTPPPTNQVATSVTTQMLNGPTEEVSIIASSFDPAIVNIQPGTTVTWINEDRISHRVVHLPELPSDRERFHSESLSPGQSFSFTFNEPGRYKYSDPQQAGGRTALVIVG
jgi:plastocyanin